MLLTTVEVQERGSTLTKTFTAEEVSNLVRAHEEVTRLEKIIKEAKIDLKAIFADYVLVCPHVDVASWTPYGGGTWYVCMSCGLEDRAVIGATSGDEYNYGYLGHVDKDYWANSNIHKISDKKSWNYRKSHGWILLDGKPVEK